MSEQPKSRALLILILGCMTALSPFSIDMYLPAFQTIADDLGTTVPRVTLSLSSYFVGLSFGQLFYGPLLDRFGRKRPLLCGLAFYIVASLLCLFTQTADGLIVWRFVQAIGGCVAGVASMAMVRDLFTLKESAKVYSTLILILGASPLLAPTIGGYLTTAYGWHSVFIALAVMAASLSLAIYFLLPESHTPDPTVTLRPGPITRGFAGIFRNLQFQTYVLAMSIAFGGFFVYIAGSPEIFLNHFKVGATAYGWIFAIVAAGIIGSSQFNVTLLRRFTNEQLVRTALTAQVIITWLFVAGLQLEILGLYGTVAMLFLFTSTAGIASPNSGALALAPFSRNAGSASALMGFLQMGMGALLSSMIGILQITNVTHIIMVMAFCSTAALTILLLGRMRIARATGVAPVHSPTL